MTKRVTSDSFLAPSPAVCASIAIFGCSGLASFMIHIHSYVGLPFVAVSTGWGFVAYWRATR